MTTPIPLPTLSPELQQTHRERLRQFYAYYAPEKTSADIDVALSRCATARGGFTKMWETLESKYGPESAVAVKAAEASMKSHVDPDSLLTHHPDPRRQNDCLPSSVVGGTNWLLEATLDSNHQQQQCEWQRQRLRRFFSRYSPKQMDSVDTILANYVAMEDGFKKMWADLEKTYGPETAVCNPPIPSPLQNPAPRKHATCTLPKSTMLPCDARYRLYRLMKAHDRNKVQYVEKVLKRYEGMEEILLRDTIKRYGAEPQAEPVQDRIQRFLMQYDEANAASLLPKLLSDYRGREMECLRDLHQRYGLEPAPPTPRAGAPQKEINQARPNENGASSNWFASTTTPNNPLERR